MNIIKSNSTLIGFYKSFLNLDDQNILQYIQSMSIAVSKNISTAKSIGSDISYKNQFVDPDVILDISYFQKIDFENENIFKFNLNSKSLFTDIVMDNAFNINAFILMSESQPDLINYIVNNDLSTDMIGIFLENLYLDKYSINYSLDSPAIVNCSFLTNLKSISKLIKYTNPNENIDYYKLSSSSKTSINKQKINEFKDISNFNNDQFIYTTKFFNINSNYNDNQSFLGPDLSSLLNGCINKFDFSVNLNRSKYYFLGNQISSVQNRQIILPIKYTLNISGISIKTSPLNASDFLSKNNLLKFSIEVGDKNSTNLSGSGIILFENLTVENYSYFLDLNGNLNYTISFSGEITPTSGFSYNFLKPIGVFDRRVVSSDLYELLTAEGNSIFTKK